MKILYALPATGNGHLSRAISLYPYLSLIGSIDFLVSGQNSSLEFPYPIKYKPKGVSLHYNSFGGVNFWKTISDINLSKIIKYCDQIDLGEYDLVISDFEPISAWACKRKNKLFVHWGHQASFAFNKVPRPNEFLNPGKWILENYVKSEYSYGIHFKSFHPNVGLPIIKDKIYFSDRITKDLITVYLPQYSVNVVKKVFENMKGVDIQIFHPDIQYNYSIGRIHFFPIDNKLFTTSLIHCKLLVCSGGFETPSEAMYLNKRIICLPIKNHYEQKCNAMVLDQMGVVVLRSLEELTTELVHKQFQSYGLSEYNFVGISAKTACLQFMNYWEEIRSGDLKSSLMNSAVY